MALCSHLALGAKKIEEKKKIKIKKLSRSPKPANQFDIDTPFFFFQFKLAIHEQERKLELNTDGLIEFMYLMSVYKPSLSKRNLVSIKNQLKYNRSIR